MSYNSLINPIINPIINPVINPVFNGNKTVDQIVFDTYIEDLDSLDDFMRDRTSPKQKETLRERTYGLLRDQEDFEFLKSKKVNMQGIIDDETVPFTVKKGQSSTPSKTGWNAFRARMKGKKMSITEISKLYKQQQ